MSTAHPSFREWQLTHAMRTDHDRYLRVRARWSLRDYQAVKPFIVELTLVMGNFARAVNKTIDQMNRLAKTLNREKNP